VRKIILAVLLLAAFAVAKDKKDYPLTGTVVSFHSQAETGGAFDSQGGFVGTSERRVYVVKTDSGTLEITGMHGRFRDRTGTVSLPIGQKLAYRLDRTYVYTVLDDGKEHRFYLMSAK
jgi:hypothetical protein